MAGRSQLVTYILQDGGAVEEFELDLSGAVQTIISQSADSVANVLIYRANTPTTAPSGTTAVECFQYGGFDGVGAMISCSPLVFSSCDDRLLIKADASGGTVQISVWQVLK